MYRALTNLRFGNTIYRKNEIIDKYMNEETINRLTNNGVISPVHSIPLSEIPFWKTKIKKLNNSIVTIVDFVQYDNQELANMLKWSLEQVKQEKAKLVSEYLIVKDKGCGC